MRSIRALFLVVAAAVALAPPAAADEAEYLRILQERFANLSAEQLTSAGEYTCAVLRSPVPSSVATTGLSENFGISISAANDIMLTAVAELDC